MNDTIQTYTDTKNPKIRARIISDYETESPRTSMDNISLFHFNKQKNWTFPEEYEDDIHFDYFTEKYLCDEDEKDTMKAIAKDYYIFWITFHNYSSAWPCFFKECELQSQRLEWVSLVPKSYNSYDLKHWELSGNQHSWEQIKLTKKQANEIFQWELKLYKQWNEWENFQVIIEQEYEWVKKDTPETKEEYETIESCGWFYGSTEEEYKSAISDIYNFNF